MKRKNISQPAVLWCRYIWEIYTCLLLSVFILICSPYGTIADFKYSLFLILCGGYSAITLISVAELVLMRQLNLSGIKKHIPVIALSCTYIALCAVSGAVSPYSYDFIKGATRYEGLLTIIICMSVFTLSSVFGMLRKHHIYIVGAVALIFSLLCFVQLSGRNPFCLYPAGYTYKDAYIAYPGEYLGTLGNADTVSAFLSVSSVMLFTAVLSRKTKYSALLIIPFIASITALILSGVSAGILSVVVSILIFLPAIFRKSRFFKYIIIGEILFCVAAVIIIAVCDFGNNGTLYEFHELLNGRISHTFGSGRIGIWKSVVSHMPKHLLFGTGPDSMCFWELDGFTKFIPQTGNYATLGIDTAHNEFLNIAAQHGILSFAVYVCIIAYAAIVFFKSKKKNLVAASAVTAYLIQSFFSFPACGFTPVFWTMLGIISNKEAN